MTMMEMIHQLRELGMEVEHFPLPGGTVFRILDKNTGDYVTDDPNLIAGRYVSKAEFGAFLFGFFAGRAV